MHYRIRTISFCSAALFLTALLCAGWVSAAERFIIKPHIEAGFKSDSNFHKSEENEQTVLTYNVKPGVELGYTTDKSLIMLDYYFNILRYDDQDDVPAGQVHADDFDYVEHQAIFTAQSQITDRLMLGLDNLYWKTRDPASADATSNAVDRYKYNINRLTPRLNYSFGEKFSVDLKYTNLLTDYSDDDAGEGEDSDENRGTFILNYFFTPKTSVNIDYQVWARDYDKTTSDFTSNQVMANVSHQFNYLTLTAGIGYHNRDFDQTVANGDIDRLVWKISVLGQNPQDAAGTPKSSVYAALSNNLNDAGNGDTYYSATRLDLRLSYLVTERINCILSGYYQNSDYETSDREDDRWYVDLGADYQLNDYFVVGLKGGLEERDSNEAGRDYDNRFIMFNLRFNYDLGSK